MVEICSVSFAFGLLSQPGPDWKLLIHEEFKKKTSFLWPRSYVLQPYSFNHSSLNQSTLKQ